MEEALNWADWCIIGLIVISGLISLWRGLLRETFSVTIWLLTTLVAWLFLDDFAMMFEKWISSYSMRIAVASVVLVICVLLTGTIINILAGKLMSLSKLNASDRFLGIFFGLFRGIIIVTILVGIATYLPTQNITWYQNSVLVPKFEQLAMWSQTMVKSKVAPLVYSREGQRSI